MRRVLVGTVLTAIAVLVVAQPASAATTSAANAAGSGVTTTTDKSALAAWASDPVRAGAGFKSRFWQLAFDVSSAPGATTLTVWSCVDFYDHSMTFTKETCTTGQVASGFTYTLDTAHLTHASVSASGIPAQTCSTDANGEPIGQCKPAAPMSVHASWTGQGPIDTSTYTEKIPGIYWIHMRTQSRNADASATFNGKSPAGFFAGANLSASTTKEWGSPCGAAGSARGLNQPDGC